MTQAAVIDPPAATEPAPSSTSTGQYAILNLGVFACSTSVLFLKASTSHPMIIAGMRLLIAAAALTPIMIRDVQRLPPASRLASLQLRRSIPNAVLLAIHFILWAMAARMTPAANASLIVNLCPIALPFVMWFVNRERINRGEIIGTAIAMAGVIVLMGQGFQTGDGTFRGDLVSFAAMLVFCLYISIGRGAGKGGSLWAYVVPMYAMAGVWCLLAAVIARAPLPVLSSAEILRWISLGLIPTVIGHSIFNHSIKYLRGQTISINNLVQVVYAGLLGYLIFGEVPPAKLYWLGAIIVLGVVTVIRSSPLPPAEPDGA